MNFSCRIATVVGLSCAIAGFSPASAADEADRYPGAHWYVGTGIGPGFGAKYKVNGQSITFDDRLQGATDKSPLLALNIVNAGIALSPTLLFGFSGSAAAGLSNIFTAAAVGSDRVNGFGILVGAGSPLPVARPHNITFPADYSRQS